MIRINLAPGKQPVKARRAPTPSGPRLQMILLLVGVIVGVVVLGGFWQIRNTRISALTKDVEELRRQKVELEQLKLAVEGFERQEALLKQRVAVIQELQRNKVGGQELLDVLANTVNRSETLWLTSMVRNGNVLTIEGTAASVSAVANFITQLKRAGYFEKIEIKESVQDEKNTAVQTFLFTLTAEFVLPGSKPGAGAATAPARS